MTIEELKKIFAKYELDSFEGANYLSYKIAITGAEHIILNNSNGLLSRNRENPFLDKELDQTIVFAINAEFLEEIADIKLKNKIIDAYSEIVNNDWLSFETEYLSKDINEINFLDEKFIKKIEEFTSYNRFVGFSEENIYRLIKVVEMSINIKGIQNASYSVLFNILESLESGGATDLIKNHKDIYDNTKQSILNIIQSNPEFYTEDRKFFTYKKIYRDVLHRRENVELVSEINKVMKFTPDLDYYKIQKFDNQFIIHPNMKYDFLGYFNDRYSEFNKKTQMIEKIWQSLIDKKACDYIKNIQIKDRELNTYGPELILKIESDKPHLAIKLTNIIVDLISENKEVRKAYNRTSNIKNDDGSITLVIEKHLLEDIEKYIRELSLMEKFSSDKTVSQRKMKI